MYLLLFTPSSSGRHKKGQKGKTTTFSQTM